MTHVVFVGPSLPVAEVRKLHPDAVVLPPVRQGDIVSVLREHTPTAIGIIDGVFLGVLSVWHKEILLALDEGVEVYGAASMGALRAAECAPFGMVGVGRIFELYADGRLTRDDEVAVAHATAEFDHRSVSEPLVNIRLNLGAAARDGVIDAALANALLAEAGEVYFPDRSWPRVFASPLLGAEQRAALTAYVRQHGVDHKAADARDLLRLMAAQAQAPAPARLPRAADEPDGALPGTGPVDSHWALERTHYLTALAERDRWSVRDGEPISQEAIARYALVNDPAAADRARLALVELLAAHAARELGVVADEDDVAAARARFLHEQGLRDEADVAAFCRANDLSDGEFEELVAGRAALDKAIDWLLRTRFKLGVVRPLLDSYRAAGRYPQLADEAAFAQAVQGRGDDGLPTPVALPARPIRDQLADHGRATGWTTGGVDLPTWAHRHGFIHQDAVLIELERSRRARAVMAAARAAGGMMATGLADEGGQ